MKKQFIGLYAVGTQINPVSCFPSTSSAIFMKMLAVDGQFTIDSAEPSTLPLSMMKGLKPGLYVGVVTIEGIVDVKVIPAKVFNDKMLQDIIKPELFQTCIEALDDLLGVGGEEASPAYVNQDQS